MSIAAELILLSIALAAAIVLFRDARRVWRPLRLMLRGRYVEAREANLRLAGSYLRLLPGVRRTARYGVALASHMLGDFERALAEVRALDRSLGYASRSLEATTLVLVGRDLSRAVVLFEEAFAIAEVPEDLLFLGLARHALGDEAAASELLERATALRGQRRPQRGAKVLVDDRLHHEAIFHTARGLLLVSLDRTDEAYRDFARAAEVPLQNWYTDRARELLPPVKSDGDPRSSLAPQVIE